MNNLWSVEVRQQPFTAIYYRLPWKLMQRQLIEEMNERRRRTKPISCSVAALKRRGLPKTLRKLYEEMELRNLGRVSNDTSLPL